MKKTQLKIHVERLSAAYEKNNRAWATLNLLYAAMKSGDDAPLWAVLESIKGAGEAVGDVGLDLAEFLDAYNFGGDE